MAAPCQCAGSYDFLRSNLDTLINGAGRFAVDQVKVSQAHLCEAVAEVERDCGVDMTAVRQSAEALQDPIEEMNIALLRAISITDPTAALVAPRGRVVRVEDVSVIMDKPLALSIGPRLLDSERRLLDAAQAVQAGVERTMEACTTPACGCGKSFAAWGDLDDGMGEASERLAVGDLAALGLALQGAAKSIAAACALPPPPEEMFDEVSGRLALATSLAPPALKTREMLRERTREVIARERDEFVEIIDLPGVQGGVLKREIRGAPGKAPPRIVEAKLALEKLEAEMEKEPLEAKQIRVLNWLLARDRFMRVNRIPPCPVSPKILEAVRPEQLALLKAVPGGEGVVERAGFASGADFGIVPLVAAVAAPVAVQVVKEAAPVVKEEVGKAFKQEEPDKPTFDAYAKLVGIPAFTEGERSVLDVVDDTDFLQQQEALGFTNEQLLNLDVDRHRNLVHALQSGALTAERLHAMSPPEARDFADANPEPKEDVLEARRRFEARQKAKGLVKKTEVTQGRILATPGSRGFKGADPIPAAILRAPPVTTVRWVRAPKPPKPCGRLADNLKAAEEALRGAEADVGLPDLLTALLGCERDAIESIEDPRERCGDARRGVETARDTLAPNEVALARTERELVKCLGKRRSREAGLPGGRDTSAEVLRGFYEERDVQRYREARESLLEAVGDVGDYLLTAQQECSFNEQLPGLVALLG